MSTSRALVSGVVVNIEREVERKREFYISDFSDRGLVDSYRSVQVPHGIFCRLTTFNLCAATAPYWRTDECWCIVASPRQPLCLPFALAPILLRSLPLWTYVALTALDTSLALVEQLSPPSPPRLE